ncbi:MAG: response regulator [Pseudomonadota bacterium]
METTLPWVAIIDDEDAVRRALGRLLRSAGIAASDFACGPELFQILHDNPPYCVLLDLHMPGMRGIDVLGRLQVEVPLTSVIIMTGHHSPDEQARAMRGNPIAYLQKPINDQDLLDALAAARCAWDQA